MNDALPVGLFWIVIFLVLALKAKIDRKELESRKPKKIPDDFISYKRLRENALNYKKEDTSLLDDNPLYGIVMDINFGDEIMTLFTLREGNLEIYYAKGGYIFLEREDNLIAAMETVEYFKTAKTIYKKGIKTNQVELPNIYSVNFFFLTTEGRRVIIEDMQHIVPNVSVIYDLYDRANRIIIEIMEKIERDSDSELNGSD